MCALLSLSTFCAKYERGWYLPVFADNWGQKAKRRRSEGTGRMSYLKTIARRLKNGFRYVQSSHIYECFFFWRLCGVGCMS